jgi:hypothetical protein
MNIINDLVSLILNPFGQFIYGVFQSIYTLLIVIILILFFSLFLLIRQKISTKRKIVVISFVIFCIFFGLIIPFQRGEKINKIKEYGLLVVQEINNYKQETGHFPRNFNEIQLSVSKLESLNSSVTYSYINMDSLNKMNREDNGYVPITEDKFYLTISNKILGLEYFRLNSKNYNLILTDD